MISSTATVQTHSSADGGNSPSKHSSSSSSNRMISKALVVLGLLILLLQCYSLLVQHHHVLHCHQENHMDRHYSHDVVTSDAAGNGDNNISTTRSSDLLLTEDLWNLQPHVERPYTWEVLGNDNNIPSQPLNFLHIPKTGGSSVVEAAIRAGLNWGDCLFQQSWEGRICPSPPAQEWPEEPPDQQWGRVWWHIPLQHLPTHHFVTHEALHNPYQGHDLFAIVRNPYDRAVSEFYYHCDQFPNLCKGMDGPRAARVLNRNIQKACKTLLMAPYKSPEYFFHWGHWIPQYDYVWHKKGHRLIQHLLHTERLEQEFASLMQAYNLSMQVKLPHHAVKARGATRMDVHNLTLATVKMIEVVYERDFELGGYTMMSPLLHHHHNQAPGNDNDNKKTA